MKIGTIVEVVETICDVVASKVNETTAEALKNLITHVDDRPGHDQRYAIDASKIKSELGWEPMETFESGMSKTIEWYLRNSDWCDEIAETKYARERLGTNKS